MAGGNLAAGIGLLALVIITVFFVEYIESEGEQVNGAPGDDTADFVSFDIGTIEDAPTIVNGVYVMLLGTALAAGIILVVAGIAGTLAGGG